MKTAIVQFRIGYVDKGQLADTIARMEQFMWVSDAKVKTYNARRPKR